MTLKQDIEFLKIMTFNSIEEMNENKIIQKYFDVKKDGKGAIEHIFKGFYDNMNYLNGYHSEILFPNLYGMNTQNCLSKKEPYKLKLNAKKLDPSSFFPITMSCSSIIIASLLVYERSDIVTNKRTYSMFINEYHLNLKIVLSFNGKIFTSYPIV